MPAARVQVPTWAPSECPPVKIGRVSVCVPGTSQHTAVHAVAFYQNDVRSFRHGLFNGKRTLRRAPTDLKLSLWSGLAACQVNFFITLVRQAKRGASYRVRIPVIQSLTNRINRVLRT